MIIPKVGMLALNIPKMGTIIVAMQSAKVSLSDALFPKVRQLVLGLVTAIKNLPKSIYTCPTWIDY